MYYLPNVVTVPVVLKKCIKKNGVRLDEEISPAEPLGSECIAPFQKLPPKYQCARITDVMFRPPGIACKCSSDGGGQPFAKAQHSSTF